jgi:hypothetical protein
MREANIKFNSNIYHWSTRLHIDDEIHSKESMYMSEHNGGEKTQDWISPVEKIYESHDRLFILNGHNRLEYIYLLDEIESYNTYDVDEKGNKLLEV